MPDKKSRDSWGQEQPEPTTAGTPDVPGADTATHGGSGAPPSVDPEVQALIDSGKKLEVGGDNKLREVKPPDDN